MKWAALRQPIVYQNRSPLHFGEGPACLPKPWRRWGVRKAIVGSHKDKQIPRLLFLS